MTREREPRRDSFEGLWAGAALLGLGLMVAGVNQMYAGRRVGAIFAIVGVGVWTVGFVIGGALAYRRVMRRAWPKVRPLDDDDD